MPATLPESLYDRDTIDNMEVGERRYTVPWAMVVDVNGDCFLSADYPAEMGADGTVQMLVERRQDGYHVWPGTFRYRNQKLAPGTYIGIAAVHTDD